MPENLPASDTLSPGVFTEMNIHQVTGWRRFAILMPVAILLVLSTQLARAAHNLTAEQSVVLSVWLSHHPELRLATVGDCERCDDDVQMMRRGWGEPWTAVPDYHPYQVRGDFNGDGIEDFAVVLVDTKKKQKAFVLAIFNGLFDTKSKEPAYVEKDLDLRHQGLFFGPPRPRPFRLLLGPFESEGVIFEPKNGSYQRFIPKYE